MQQISLDSLNPSQREAALHVEGPLLVLAGPGSGKTRVVTHRVAHLITQGIPAHQIVALTFTNKAADEMRKRVTELVGPQPIEMGTFHRFFCTSAASTRSTLWPYKRLLHSRYR